MTIRGGAVGASLKARRCEGEESLLLGHRDSLVYPSRTRNAECVAPLEDRSPAIAGLLSKPSDGLEPSTPLLTMRCEAQMGATVARLFADFRGR
jgi:hypothetical protein